MGDEFFDNKDNKTSEWRNSGDLPLGCFSSIFIGMLIVAGLTQLLKFFSVDTGRGAKIGFLVAVVLDIIVGVCFMKFTERKYIGVGALIPLMLIFILASIGFLVMGACAVILR